MPRSEFLKATKVAGKAVQQAVLKSNGIIFCQSTDNIDHNIGEVVKLYDYNGMGEKSMGGIKNKLPIKLNKLPIILI
jgi:hypothetical protein